MGNKTSLLCNNHDQQNKAKRITKHLNKIATDDTFIVKFNRNNSNIIKDLSLFDVKRVIFISLIGIYETYENCPSFVLYSSLFIVPLKQIWVNNYKKYQEKIKEKLFGSQDASTDTPKMIKFIELLRWKQSRGLIFWMLDEYENKLQSVSTQTNPLVCPFWCYLSNKLVTLDDPVTHHKYKPVQFDINWWSNVYNQDENHLSKYNVKVSSILTELYFMTGKYKYIQELLHQSNPKSFNIVIRYHKYCSNNTNKMYKVSTNILQNLFDDNNNCDTVIRDDHSEWYISSDYDPNDIEN